MRGIGCVILGAVLGSVLVLIFQGKVDPLIGGFIAALAAGSFMRGLPYKLM